jgi:hypothetical protein
MRTFDFTPYYRSTVGFDLLDQSIRSDWRLTTSRRRVKTSTESP